MSRLKRIIREVHGITGLVVGIVIIIVALSGCVYTFQREIRSVLYPHLLKISIPENTTRLSVDSIASIAASYHAKTGIREIVVSHDPEKSVKVYMKGEYLLYMHPYTGEVLGLKNTRKDPFLLAWSLHTQLGLGKAGGKIVGWATFACVPLIFTGLWLWWPVARNSWKKAFRLPFKGRWKPVNFQWHKNGGFYASVFLLFICLSGMIMSFKWFENTVYWLTGSPPTQRVMPKPAQTARQQGTIQKSVDYTFQKFPQVKEVNIFFPSSYDRVFMFIAKYDDRLGRREVLYFNPGDGELLHGSYDADNSIADRLKAVNYNIHSGQVGGLPGRIIAFLATLFAAYLAVSGSIMWFHRNARSKSKVHHSNKV